MQNLFKKNNREQLVYNELYNSFYERFGCLSASGILLRASERFGKKEALKTASGYSISYQDLYKSALKVSGIFSEMGVRPRDHVLLFIENSVEFYIGYWAALLVGAVVIPVNTFLHINEVAYIIKDASPDLIIVSDRLKSVIVEAASMCDETIQKKIFPDSILNVSLEGFDESTVLSHDVTGEDTAVILYTSGTTGQPKGVVLSAKNIVTNAMQAAARFQLLANEQETFFAVLPLFHAFAQNTCIWLPAITGSPVIVVSKIDRTAITDGLKLKPTVFLGFPALYGLLCLMKRAPLDSVKLFISGADAMPDKIRAAFSLLYGRKILSGYGLTEASPVVAINYLNDDRQTSNVGEPVVGIDIQIRDDSGRVLDKGCIGTLWIKGANIMKGYYKAEQATSEAIQSGWLCTGDIASLSMAGEIVIHGRNKDLIIHKGFNIYPQEVENVLLKSSLVMRAAVIGHSDDSAGEIPVAYISLKMMKKNVEKELRQLCAAHLAAYKIPRTFIFKDDLPLSPTGKIDKKKLKNRTQNV
ncbi:AMP-binding protein [Candidatus Babeliales bacterium]|nr:AMP-binding protein [Candidatus Babeliales bacterium]